MLTGVVIVLMSFNVEKDKARFPVSKDYVETFARRDLFHDELIEGRLQWRGKIRGILRCKPYRAQRGTAQDIVKDKNREKRIGSDFETQCLQFRCCGEIGRASCRERV